MSSVAEHLAAFEFYKANGQHQHAADEGYLFLQVHWQELIAAYSPAAMELGRADFERRVREQHPEIAGPLVEKWRASMVPPAQPEQVAQDSVPADILKYAKAMQRDGYRAPLSWARSIVDWVVEQGAARASGKGGGE